MRMQFNKIFDVLIFYLFETAYKFHLFIFF
jgi:hypothetical protein